MLNNKQLSRNSLKIRNKRRPEAARKATICRVKKYQFFLFLQEGFSRMTHRGRRPESCKKIDLYYRGEG
jgi:hypothetical protein